MSCRLLFLLLLWTAPAAWAQPANDSLDAAEALAALPADVTGTNVGATHEPGEARASCTESDGDHSVWWSVTPEADTTLQVTTVGSDFDTVLSVWTGGAHPLAEVACNDDVGDDLTSQVAFAAEAGQTYYLRVTGADGATGSIALAAEAVEPPENDDRSDAISVTLPFDGTGTNATATLEDDEVLPSCAGNDGGNSVWWSFRVDVEEDVEITTVGSDFDTVLSVWTGRRHPLTEVACNDDVDDGEVTSSLVVEAESARTYFVRVSGYDGGGAIALQLTGLGVAQIAVDTSPLQAEVARGDTSVVPLTIANPGTAPLAFSILPVEDEPEAATAGQTLARSTTLPSHLRGQARFELDLPSAFVEVVGAQGAKARMLRRCGTPAPSAVARELSRMATHPMLRTAPQRGGEEEIIIPVAVHVVRYDDGTGDVSDAAIEEQIEVLDAAYEGYGFGFTLASIDRTNNTAWTDHQYGTADEVAMKEALAIDPARTMNLYVVQAPRDDTGASLLGYASFPWFYPEADLRHGVVVLAGSLPGGDAFPYDEGDTATHETGHYLGLFHTWGDGGCGVDDEVDDTNNHDGPDFGCPNADDCAADSPNPVENFMNYTDDACMDLFSEGQAERMQALVAQYRPTLLEGGPEAPNWITPRPLAGVVPPGGEVTVQVTLGDTLLRSGRYAGRLLLEHDAPETGAPVEIPVLLAVGRTAVTTTYAPGWDLVSVPVTQQTMTVDALFPEAAAGAFAFDPEAGYVEQQTLEVGEGYWLQFADVAEGDFEGIPDDPAVTELVVGWNLVGTSVEALPSAAATTNPRGLVVSPFYGFGPAGYEPASTLEPGRGYWVQAVAPGTLFLTPSPVRGAKTGASAAKASEAGLPRLVLTGAEGQQRTLLLAEVPGAALPPPPPAALADARFATGRRAEALPEAGALEVQVQGLAAPVRARAEGVAPGRAVRLRDKVGGRLLDVLLTAGETASLPQGLGRFEVEAAEAPMQTFALDDLAPNPANAGVEVAFVLPAAAHARLVVYDALGRRVAVLHDAPLEAGRHLRRLDATALASGVYVVRLQAEGRHATQRLVVAH